MNLKSNIPFILRVLKSCKTEDQFVSAVLWAAKVVKGDDRKVFIHVLVHNYKTVDGFDCAMQAVKNEFIKRMA